MWMVETLCEKSQLHEDAIRLVGFVIGGVEFFNELLNWIQMF